MGLYLESPANDVDTLEHNILKLEEYSQRYVPVSKTRKPFDSIIKIAKADQIIVYKIATMGIRISDKDSSLIKKGLEACYDCINILYPNSINVIGYDLLSINRIMLKYIS